jgi:hypothetical protein
MRQRHQAGGLRKQRGRWLGMWWDGGKRKSRVLGLVKEMTKSKARDEVAKIVAELKATAGCGVLGNLLIRCSSLTTAANGRLQPAGAP